MEQITPNQTAIPSESPAQPLQASENHQKRFSYIIAGIFILLAIIMGGGYFIMNYYLPQTTSNSAINTSISITSAPLFTLPAGHKMSSKIHYSADHKHSAYIVQTGNNYKDSNYYVVYDNVAGKQYGNIVVILDFSPDGQKLAYVASSKGAETSAKPSYVVVINGQESPPYKRAYFSTFSPDSKRFAYNGSKDNFAYFVVVDGIEGKTYTQIENVVFSPDSTKFAYHASTNRYSSQNSSYVVVNNKEIGPYGNVGNLSFSPDSKQITFTGYREGKGTFQEKIDVSSF